MQSIEMLPLSSSPHVQIPVGESGNDNDESSDVESPLSAGSTTNCPLQDEKKSCFGGRCLKIAAGAVVGAGTIALLALLRRGNVTGSAAAISQLTDGVATSSSSGVSLLQNGTSATPTATPTPTTMQDYVASMGFTRPPKFNYTTEDIPDWLDSSDSTSSSPSPSATTQGTTTSTETSVVTSDTDRTTTAHSSSTSQSTTQKSKLPPPMPASSVWMKVRTSVSTWSTYCSFSYSSSQGSNVWLGRLDPTVSTGYYDRTAGRVDMLKIGCPGSDVKITTYCQSGLHQGTFKDKHLYVSCDKAKVSDLNIDITWRSGFIPNFVRWCKFSKN